ncbi:hypothetical protein ONQ97_28180, partial [Salmonella enterica subsp. enterica serovar Virginia]|nr:hypothetical protein [Salmonella enterica subsp. enterica serovar Virginia]
IIMTYTLPSLVKSPSGAAFGSVLGLMAFFYFFARLTLFCAAWVHTSVGRMTPPCVPFGSKPQTSVAFYPAFAGRPYIRRWLS